MSTEKGHHDGFETIEGALTKTEQYIEDNQKSILIIILAIFVLFGGYFAFKKFVLTPKEAEAQGEMFLAEMSFARDSFNLAIYGDGSFSGFEDIKNDYGITKSANLANYYMGIGHLHNGEYEEAIDALKDFDGSDKVVAAISLGAIGDAYVELEEYDKAISYYNRAANYDENKFTAPIFFMKLGNLYKYTESYKKALDCYKTIQTKFPGTTEARTIEKYIAAVEAILSVQ